MSDTENQAAANNAVQAGQKSAGKATDQYEALVQRLAFAAVNEQRRGRRWRIFFILLTFLYLTPFVLLMLDAQGLDLLAKAKPSSGKHSALVKMNGIIADGAIAGSESIIEGLRSAYEDKDTAGVILEINSPGGSPVQSADIYDEIRRLRAEHEAIPLYVVVNDIAASGGYFVAAAADKIYVNKSSLVGSIGVRMDSFGLVDMIEKLGIERRLLTAGKHKGLLDPFLPENSEQKAHLQAMLDQVHGHFIDAVKEGRGERLKDHPDLFSGLVWSGEEAVNMGLADGFANTQKVATDIIKQEDIVDFTPKEMLLDRIAERVGASIGNIISQQINEGLQLQ